LPASWVKLNIDPAFAVGLILPMDSIMPEPKKSAQENVAWHRKEVRGC